MRKKVMKMLPLMLIMSGCNNSNEQPPCLPDYIPYAEIPENYTSETALEDNCIVFESRSNKLWLQGYAENILQRSWLVGGAESWKKFLALTEQGEASQLRLVYDFSEKSDDDVEQPTNNQRIYDLFYEDGKYLLYYEEEGEEHSLEYAALKCFEGKYHDQEWFLLGEYYLDITYTDLLNANPLSSQGFTVDEAAVGKPTWQIIYFANNEEDTD